MKGLHILLLFSIFHFHGIAQSLTLDLQQCIRLAADSSRNVAEAKSRYLAGYWEYQAYKASKLPSLSFQSTPFQYNSTFVSRYDYQEDIEVYRNQKTFYLYGSLVATQQVGFTGGNLFIQSDLNYINNFGDNSYSQFSTIPFKIGYSQSLFGYNDYKWAKRIENLKFERTKKAYVNALESLSIEVAQAFFSLLQAQITYSSAQDELWSSDTLLRAGKEKELISAISEADINVLTLDHLNAENEWKEAQLYIRKARKELGLLLRTDKDITVNFPLEENLPKISVSPEQAIQYMKVNNYDLLTNKLQILETERILDKAKKEARFSASLSASIGFNQVAENFSDAYTNPLRQELALLNLTVPIIDWGTRKSKVKKAQNEMEATKISSESLEEKLKTQVEQLVESLNLYQDNSIRTRKAYLLAEKSYDLVRQRFRLGIEAVNSVTLGRSRLVNSRKGYINALMGFWTTYYAIRKLTLYDFEREETLFSCSEYTWPASH